MKEMNAFQIQQKLTGVPCVSVPWIQREFGLTYGQAREFLAQLQLRGWAGKTVQGNRYPVYRENLRLRFLERGEVDGLIVDINHDCGCILRFLKEGKNATFDELNELINDEEDTTEAIKILEKHRLVYLIDDVYFSCVSDKTADVMMAMARTKNRYHSLESMLEDADKMKKMREFFDALFADDE